MPTLHNKTAKPLRVPLPGGKTLHLGPHASGQVTPKAVDHPPVQKLVEAGTLEVTEDERRPSRAKSGKPGPGGAPRGNNPTGGVRHTGDR